MVVSGKVVECDVWWSVGRCWSVMCGGQWEGVGVWYVDRSREDEVRQGVLCVTLFPPFHQGSLWTCPYALLSIVCSMLE